MTPVPIVPPSAARQPPLLPDPPQPFDCEAVVVAADTILHRVHRNTRSGVEFNPGVGAPTRFAFCGEPVVPVLYAAETPVGAVAESLLHDIPFTGGLLPRASYEHHVLSILRVARPLRLASFLGTGLRRLGVEAQSLTASPASHYSRTLAWAAAAHDAGYDGVAYMSRLHNSDRAFCLFGDRIGAGELVIEPEHGWAFGVAGAGRDWLVDLCAPLGVDVLLA